MSDENKDKNGIYVDEERYNRIVESYNSGCFKQLHKIRTSRI